MPPDTVAIAVPAIGTGVAVAALIRAGLTEVHRDVADLRERMVRLEGLFEGSARREPAAPGTGTT